MQFYTCKEAIRDKKIPSQLIDDNLGWTTVNCNISSYRIKPSMVIFKRLTEIINNGGIDSEIMKSFPFDQITQQDNFISLLYFLAYSVFLVLI
jgi:hypothetical protein